MKYKTWSIEQAFIKECGLNEDTLRTAINDLVEKMQDSPFHCSGMVIAARINGTPWRYYGEKYFGEELPSVTDKMSVKVPGLIAYVVATIREADNGTDDLG